MSDLSIFAFDSAAVRVVHRVGEPWFVATDVAGILGYRDASNMTRMLEEDEADTHIVSTSSESGCTQDREVTVISESGLYACILKSRRPEAKRFRKWVTSEVLPSIRKTGGYQDTAAAPPAPATLFLSHAADIMVAADRTFRAVVRAGRTAGLSLPRTLRRANDITLAKTGINMLAELQADDHLGRLDAAEPAGRTTMPACVAAFWADLQAGALHGLPLSPLLSTQAHRLYQHWCLQHGHAPVALQPLVSALVHHAGLRPARKRYQVLGGTAQGSFLFPPDAGRQPDDPPEPAWLGLHVARINEVLENLQQ